MPEISEEIFGEIDGSAVLLFRLSVPGLEVLISNFGATIVSINMQDRNGDVRNIVAGYDSLEQYEEDSIYAGSVVGRYANRIAFGKFELDKVRYELPVNNEMNHLHGGFKGFNKQLWEVEKIIREDNKVGVILSYMSPDGEEGYPGNLNVRVSYTLDENKQLIMEYAATTDRPTIVSLTNHSYFNLSGFEEPVYDHELMVRSSKYTEKNENNIPTGKLLPVKDGPFDFGSPTPLGKHIHELEKDRGYDHNFVLENEGALQEAAILYHPASGRRLSISTDRPGIQVYTANWWDGSLTGRQGRAYEEHGAVALETQAFPDSPNHPEFPSTTLRPGEEFGTRTVFKFETAS